MGPAALCFCGGEGEEQRSFPGKCAGGGKHGDSKRVFVVEETGAVWRRETIGETGLVLGVFEDWILMLGPM